MKLPLIFLSLGTIFSGMLFSDFFIGNYKKEFWNEAIVLMNAYHHHLPLIQTLIIKSSVAFGILLASVMYFYNKGLPYKISNTFKFIYLISLNKWYFDEIYNYLFVKPYFYIAKLFWKRGDENLIDGYGPNGISKIISLGSYYLSRFQSGYLFHYAFAMLGGLVIILTWFIYY
tara:strand:- start:32 stop:550 length:519 start_codon:yes stop_codon:yes gene_type:complete